MFSQPSPWREDLPPELPADDETAKILVMTIVVSRHPDGISVMEAAYELSRNANEDWVEQTVRDLVGAGLLRCEDQLLFATFMPPNC